MKNKVNISLIIAAILVAAGLIWVGCGIKSGLTSFAHKDRVASVRGLCEREVPANLVTWPIVTQDVGNDLPELYRSTHQINTRILKFLNDNGISSEEISVAPLDVTDNLTSSYDPERVQQRYKVTNVIVVKSNQVDKVRKLIDRQTELISEGIAILAGSYQYPISYDYTDLNSIKPDMIAEATKNAREAADKFAQDSESELGGIRSAYQGQFTINDRDQYTPYIKTVRVVTTLEYYLKD